jgi:hypothetical protein
MPDDDAGAKQAKTIKELEDRLAALESDRDKWKELSKKHEQRSQENLSAVEELKALKESKQTDEEKLATKLADLEKRANDAEHRALRADIAQEKKLSAAQTRVFNRLQGATKEELETAADELIESFPATNGENGSSSGVDSEKERKQERGDPGRRPKEKLRSGSVTDDDDKDEDFDPHKVAEIVRRRSF